MPKEFYIRTRTAGRYRLVARYSRALPNDSKPTRQAKHAATVSAQKYVNVKNSSEKLQLLLCANFDSKDAHFCTFTFTDEWLPVNQKHTRQIFRDYLAQLRKEWKRQGRSLLYIYTIEGNPLPPSSLTGSVDADPWEITPWRDRERWSQMDAQEAQDGPEPPTRLHVHCFLHLLKEDYEPVKALWPYGQAYLNPMKVNELTTFQRLASYVTKEKRDGGKGNGNRAYVPSLNLDKPEITGHWCTEYEGIVLPKGAELIRSWSEQNEIHGTSMECISYRMPRPQQTPQPYKSKGKLQQKGRRSQRE